MLYSLGMVKEQDCSGIPLTGVYIDLKNRSIELEDDQGVVARLTFASSGTIFFHPAAGIQSPGSPAAEAQQPGKTTEPLEKEQTVTLTGRLKTQPKEGKPDSRGNPTAYARLAAHQEGQDEAHVYLATFHRHATPIALSLPKDAQVTVTGYPHPSNDPSGKRMDTFSVINLVSYPGKQEKG